MTQGEDLDVLFPIVHRQQPQCSEGVPDGEIGQAKDHAGRGATGRPLMIHNNHRQVTDHTQRAAS